MQLKNVNLGDWSVQLCALLCFVFSGWLYWSSNQEPLPEANAARSTVGELLADNSLRLEQVPIEQLRLGQRVVAFNPDRNDIDANAEEVAPATWKEVRLIASFQGADDLYMSFLRSPEWLTVSQAKVGAEIHIDLAELGFSGPAKVIDIRPCPPRAPDEGDGRHLITGRFAHRSNGNLLNVYLEGEDQPHGVTAPHRYWVINREAFVAAEDLQPGDRVRTIYGPTSVRRIEPAPADEMVYNIEVHGEHVYRVGKSGVLVHNTYGDGPMTPDQIALKELVQEASLEGHRPLTLDQANTILDWANEVGTPTRASPTDLATPSNWTANPVPHIHVPGTSRKGHVPVEPGLPPR